MSSTPEEIQKLVGSLVNPISLIPPLKIEESQKTKSIENVIGNYFISLIIGEDLVEDATSFNGFKFTDEMWKLQLLTLCVEDKELGSFFINVSKQYSPVTYEGTCLAKATQLLGFQLTPAQKDKLKYNIIPSHYVNNIHIEDVIKCMEKIKLDVEIEKENKRRKKNKNGEENDEVPLEENVVNLFKPRYISFLEAFMKPIIGYREGPRVVDINTVTDINQLCPSSDSGSISTPKVLVVVTPVPNIQGKIVAYLIRFCQLDKQWNPGVEIYDLSLQCRNRKLNGKNPFYKDPWPQYTELMGQKFPVFDMSEQAWIDCVNRTTGVIPNMAMHFQQIGQEQRFDDLTSYLHPINVCTLSRALKRISEVGGLCGDASEYGSNNIATWPGNLKNYMYAPDQWFWHDKERIGLLYQYFPAAYKSKESLAPELIEYLNTHIIANKNDIFRYISKKVDYKTNNMFIYKATDADHIKNNVYKLLPHDIYDSYQRYLKGERVNEPKEYQQELARVNQQQLIEYKNLVQLDSSNTSLLPISDSYKRMIEWYVNRSKTISDVTCEVEICDDTMDPFSNYVIKELLIYKFHAKCLQPFLLFKLHGLFIVYKRNRSIGYNVIIHGSPGDGKSDLIDRKKIACIPDTFRNISRCTDQANYTAKHIHDEILGNHEMKQKFVIPGKDIDDSVNMKKDALSGGQTSSLRWKEEVINGTKVTTNTLTVTAHDSSEVNCTNFRPQKGALSDRYHVILLTPSEIGFHQWRDKPKEEERFDYEDFLDRYRCNQFLTMNIRKMMSLYVLPCSQINMQLFDDVNEKMIDTLQDWGVIKSGLMVGRIETLIRNFAEQMVLERAFLHTFHLPGSLHYKKPFKLEYLLDCAPLLYCTLSIILFAWTAHSTEIIKPEYISVIKAAAKLCLKGKPYDVSKSPLDYYYEDYEDKISFKRDKNFRHNQKDGPNNQYCIDLNRFELKGNVKQVAMEIAELTENPTLKPDVVEQILKELTEMPISPFIKGIRNGYVDSIPEDDLRYRHKGIKQTKIPLNISDYKNVIKKITTKIAVTLYEDILVKLIDIPSISYKTDAQAKLVLPFSEIDIVFLNITKDEWNCSNVSELIITLEDYKTLDIKELPADEMKRIASSFSGINIQYSDNHYELIPALTYIEARIILYFMDQKYVLENGVKETFYLEKPIITDNGLSHFGNEYDINQLRNIPLGDELQTRHSINVVQIERNRVCFTPLVIELYDPKIIPQAFAWSTISSFTKPQKYILGWTQDDNISKLKVVEYTQEFINNAITTYDSLAPLGAVSKKEGILFKRAEYEVNAEKDILYGTGVNAEKRREKTTKASEIIGDLDKWSAIQQHLICGRPFSEPVRDPEYLRKQYTRVIKNINYPHSIMEKEKEFKNNVWEINSARKNMKSKSAFITNIN